ncbi:uncharacterized protein L201_007107 [Kwoniella dendrophila CBS 6074]|uniref:Uncharacterized protein n=1 Tax=Kwoniella dendrophila CBS 6074 TaxID=1295534 RepID=A0AAX4K4P5_9TREE
MSNSPDGRKRPRQSDVDERDAKRLKNVNGIDNVNNVNENEKTKEGFGEKTRSQEWVSEQMNRMEKLYKEVLIQAALVFQHQSFCKRLGMSQQRVPTHMMHRLETTWRTYEGLRRQTEWCMAQSGEKSPKSPMINKPSSTLAAINRLASNPVPPKTMELPTPVNLSIIGEYIPLASPPPLKQKDIITLDQKTIVDEISIPKTEPQIENQVQVSDSVPPNNGSISAENQDLAMNGDLNTAALNVSDTSIPQPLAPTQPQAQTGLVEPPPPIQQIQAPIQPIEPQIQPDGTMDYSTLGLDELTALINGNSFDSLSSSMNLPTNTNSTNYDVNTVTNLNNQDNAQNQVQQDTNQMFASLGLDTGVQTSIPSQSTISSDQPQQLSNDTQNQTGIQAQLPDQQQQQQQQTQQPAIEFDFSQALTNGTAGLDGDTDFSALAGLFANEQPPIQIPDQNSNTASGPVNTDINKMDGLDSIIGNAINGDNNTNTNTNSAAAQSVENPQKQQDSQQDSQGQIQNSNGTGTLAAPEQSIQSAQQKVKSPVINQTQAQSQPQAEPPTPLLEQNQKSSVQGNESSVLKPQPSSEPQQTDLSQQPTAQSTIPDQSQSQQQARTQQQPNPPTSAAIPVQPQLQSQAFQPDFQIPQPFQPDLSGQFDQFNNINNANNNVPVDGSGNTGEFGEIDMADFNFDDAGLEGMGMGGDEFERLMADW